MSTATVPRRCTSVQPNNTYCGKRLVDIGPSDKGSPVMVCPHCDNLPLNRRKA